MKRLFTILFIAIAQITFGQNNDIQSIQKILSNQINAWNSGNVDAFMVGYWESDSLVFIGKSGITYGYNKTLANYKKGYPDTVSMGKLTFTILTIKQLSSKYYTVVGKWHLSRTVGNLQGHFSLLFKKIHNKWVIIQDHSS